MKASLKTPPRDSTPDEDDDHGEHQHADGEFGDGPADGSPRIAPTISRTSAPTASTVSGGHGRWKGEREHRSAFSARVAADFGLPLRRRIALTTSSATEAALASRIGPDKRRRR